MAERKVLDIQQHVLFKEVDKMASEIEGINLDNDQKEIIKNTLQRNIEYRDWEKIGRAHV